jgi:hypothetical protein
VKKYYTMFFVTAFASCILLLAGSAHAGITLANGYWSTTFNCADWTYYPGDNPNTGCDGLTRAVDGNSGYYIRINSADNNPNGGGGKGLGWQVGNGSGTSTSPTGSNIEMAWGGSTHFWIRWYVSLPSGMPISNATLKDWKVVYVYDAGGNGSSSFYIDTVGSDVISLYDRTNRSTGTYGFDDIYGSTSNGSWVAIEMEFDIPNHTWRYWVYKNNVDDSTPKYVSTSVSYRMSSIGLIKFPENLKSSGIPNSPVRFRFDDIAISTKGRIGPVGAPGSGNDTLSPPTIVDLNAH